MVAAHQGVRDQGGMRKRVPHKRRPQTLPAVGATLVVAPIRALTGPVKHKRASGRFAPTSSNRATIGVAANRSHRDLLRVLIVESPACRVFVNVAADAIQRLLVANNVLIIVALPEPPAECRPRPCLHTADVM